MGMYHQIRVLIVEDDTLVGEMLQGLLEEIGYAIVGKAVDGAHVINMVQALQPDVVLMDIEMPDMNGIEAARAIMTHQPTPVVMVTAHETPQLVKQASEAGAGAYLVKPPNAREMERAITIAMARFDDMMELRRLNAELHARNEDLDAFAHTVAHDLQSPLGLMVGYAEVLGYDYPSLEPEAVQAYLQTIAQNGRKMSNIIDALLLLAGVRKAGVKLEPLNMAAIVAETRQRLTPLFDDFQPKIVMPPDWPVAMGYAPWVEEIWVNYVSNGIKYGGAPPRLELGAMALPNNMVRFWVHDNGPGLSPDEQNRLFTPFTRLDPSRIKGYGLGLSIVRRIVERLGGHVQVESEDVPGKGSIFSFTLCAPTHPDFS